MPERAFVEFPGVLSIVRCTVTWTHGVSPNVFTLTVAPQEPIAGGGTLTLRWGETVIQFPDCRVDSASFRFDGTGRIVEFQLLDRRWKWAFPIIDGQWNLRADDGTIIARVPAARGIALDNTEITPQDAARECFTALGEHNVDVSALPNDARPLLEWDHKLAAQALVELCEQFNCRVMLGLDNRPRVVALGEGAALPDGPLIDVQSAVDPPERPDSILMATAPWRAQGDYELEAVVETNEQVVVSLTAAVAMGIVPPGGWADVDPLWGLAGVPDVEGNAPNRVKQSAFRWYRIKTPIAVPFFGNLDNLDYVLPIEPTQCDVRFDGARKRQRPAVVYGRFFFDEWNLGEQVNSVSNAALLQPLTDANQTTLVRTSWQLDTERGIVIFSEPVTKLDANNKIAAADLRLRVALSVRVKETRGWNRYARELPLPGQQFDTGPMTIMADDLVPCVSARYGPNFVIQGLQFNTPRLDAELDQRLLAAAKAFETHNPQAASYVGFQRIDLDGAIQAVEWSTGPGGSFTRVSRNQELDSRNTVGYRIRRQTERAAELARNPLLRGAEQDRKRAIRRGGAV